MSMGMPNCSQSTICWRRQVYSHSLLTSLAEVSRRWELVWALVVRDLKVRYRNSVLGFFWSLVTPLLQMVILTFVVKYAMDVPIANLSVKILCGLIAWTFFENGILDSCDSVLNNRDLVKKIYFPRPALPLSVVVGNLIHFALSTVVLLAWLTAIGCYPDRLFLFIIPLMIIQTLLLMGLGMIVACLHTFYRDIKFVLQALLRVFFFATPVMYPAALLHDKFGDFSTTLERLYMYNPMATIIESYRSALLDHQVPDMSFLLPIAAASLILFIIGYKIFLGHEWQFPEVI